MINHQFMLTRDDKSSMGLKTVGSAFASSIILLIQHGRASSKYFGERHSCKQIWRPLVEEILTLEQEEGRQQPIQIRCQSPQGCYCHWPCSSRVLWVYWYFLRHRVTITCEVTAYRERSTWHVLLDTFIKCVRLHAMGQPLLTSYRVSSGNHRWHHSWTAGVTPEWHGGSAGQDPLPHTLTLFHGWGIKAELGGWTLHPGQHWSRHGPLLRVEQDGVGEREKEKKEWQCCAAVHMDNEAAC